MSRLEALKRARELRKKFHGRHEVFNQSEFHEALLKRCKDLTDSALEGLVIWAAEKVDRDSARTDRDEGGPDLYPEFDMAGELHLGNGDRILKVDARIEHYQAAMALDDENLRAAKAANKRKHEILKTLEPFWDNGKRMFQAAKDWKQAQGGAA